jgi:hypothetical protein
MLKLPFFRLTVGLLISLGALSQASPSLADNPIYTGNFTAVGETGSYVYSPASSTTGTFTYSIGTPDSPFWDSGAAQWDLTTYRGSNSGSFKDLDGNTGGYWQNYPLGGSGDSSSNNVCNNSSQTLLETTDTVTRMFCTPQANGVYTYNLDTHTTDWLLGDLNSSFYSKGSFQYDPNTAGGTLDVYYQNKGTKGGYYIDIASRLQSVPEPHSGVLNVLVVGSVLGAGLAFKRQKSSTYHNKNN